MNKPFVLLVDDDGDALVSLHRALCALLPEFEFAGVATAEQAIEQVRSRAPAVVVLDLNLDPHTGVRGGLEVLQKIRGADPSCRVIVLTGHGGVENGVQALHRGAQSFLEKPAEMAHLKVLIVEGVSQAALYREYQTLKERSTEGILSSFVGVSEHAQAIRRSVQFLATTQQPVLITGETGTGKGVVARLLHEVGPRKGRPWIRYQPNFASADLTNSDLFGHVRGAFTGAQEDKKGLLERVEGGSFFLDEIDELPAAVQVTLLGVFQDQKLRPVGGTADRTVSFRLISATNRDPQEAIAQGKLRADLFHRIAHERIALLPLRSRPEDIEPLARSFLEAVSAREGVVVSEVSQAAVTKLREHRWPGNARELQATIERGAYRAAFARRQEIEPADLLLGDGGVADAKPHEGDFHSQVEHFKRSLIEEALKSHGGNQVKAAESLRLDRSTMRRFLARVKTGEAGIP